MDWTVVFMEIKFQQQRYIRYDHPHQLLSIIILLYLEAGLETRALTISGVRGAPFMNDDQPGT